MINERLSMCQSIRCKETHHAAGPRFSSARQARRPPSGDSRRHLPRLRAVFDVPDEDRFMTITEHDAPDFSYSASYLGIARGDDLAMIQITVSNTRTLEKKKALYRRIVENLKENPGLRPEDVLINLVEVSP